MADETAFTDYTRDSRSYDQTRVPAGVDLLVKALSAARAPLEQQTVLDAGCGTGNYVLPLLDHVRAVWGLELNPGMLAQARRKLEGVAGVRLESGSVLAMPFEDASVDSVALNFVIHHLPVGDGGELDGVAQAMRECERVLRPGGAVVIQTVSLAQFREGFWWAELIPDAVDRAWERYPALSQLSELLRGVGLEPGEEHLLLNEVLQGAAYLDPEGPLKAEFRAGDSTWSLTTVEELAQAQARVRDLIASGDMTAFLQRKEDARKTVGQATFVVGRKAD